MRTSGTGTWVEGYVPSEWQAFHCHQFIHNIGLAAAENLLPPPHTPLRAPSLFQVWVQGGGRAGHLPVQLLYPAQWSSYGLWLLPGERDGGMQPAHVRIAMACSCTHCHGLHTHALPWPVHARTAMACPCTHCHGLHMHALPWPAHARSAMACTCMHCHGLHMHALPWPAHARTAMACPCTHCHGLLVPCTAMACTCTHCHGLLIPCTAMACT